MPSILSSLTPKAQLILVLIALLYATAGAAEDQVALPEVPGFPSQPIRLIVYTSPGGLIDVTARRFAQLAQEHADHPFAVINRPGGGGIVAFEEALREPADGHRFLAVTRSNISKMVATGREDLIDRILWHSYIMDNAHVLITNREAGLTQWSELKAHQRAPDHDHLWLGVDIGGVKHISGVKIAEQTGIDMRWIPYGSGGEARAALLGNLGTVYLGNPRDALSSPDLDVVAVAASDRLPEFPDSPTFAELGYAGLEDELIWRGFAFRKGVPDDIQRWYDSLIRKVLADPRWHESWQGEAVNLRYRVQDAFEKIVARDREEFRAYLGRLDLLPADASEKDILERMAREPAFYALAGFVVPAFMLGVIVLGRRRFPTAEQILLSGLLLVTVIALLMSFQLPGSNPVDPIGARGVPQLWMLLLVPLLVWQLLVHGKDRPTELEGSNTTQLLQTLGIYGGSLLLMPWLGYFLVTLIYVPTLIWMLGYRRLPVIAGVTLGWLLVSELLFQRVLHVDLPRGLW
jgi:putative tricarboxylic transport membrane protein